MNWIFNLLIKLKNKSLKFGYWNLFGYWCLGIGIYQ